MAQALSSDLRARVVKAVENGGSRREVCVRFGVSYSSVNKWVSRYRQTGSFDPFQIGGYRCSPLTAERDFIRSSLEECPHMSLDRLRQRLESEKGMKISIVALWRMLRHEGLSFKKTLIAVEQKRVDIVARLTKHGRSYKRKCWMYRVVFY